MGRWEPDAQGRLLRAALDLFSERGYEATTTAQIAERAGLTKTTLFRLFTDKREIVFQGQTALLALVQQGVNEAPDDASAVAATISGLRVLSSTHGPEQRRIGRILDPILATNDELNERAIHKRFAITDALETALVDRHIDSQQAGVLADMGVRAYYAGYADWVASDDTLPLNTYVQRQWHQLREASARLAEDDAPTV